MPRDRDVQAFDARAESYEGGRHGRLHKEISDRVVELALSRVPTPRGVLDVGCGTGYALRQLAARLPRASTFLGVDAAPKMIEVARSASADDRVSFRPGTAERLPADDSAYDLVVSTTSFDHWTDQATGIRECARALASGGTLVLTDQFSNLLWPTMLGRRRQKARTRSRATELITAGRTARAAVASLLRPHHPERDRGQVARHDGILARHGPPLAALRRVAAVARHGRPVKPMALRPRGPAKPTQSNLH